MEYVRLGNTGLKVSRLCLGCMSFGSKKWQPWVLEEAESKPFFRRAVELGINFFDTADMYSAGASEEVTGRALKEIGLPRDRSIIATKVFNPMGEDPNQRGLSRKHILHAIDDSLRRLQTDYVDLYQIHRFDSTAPIEETIEALHDVVKAGKARYIGASSMYAWQFAKMLYTADRMGMTRFVSMQNHYNLVYREEEREMIPLCIEEGVGTIPWSPLARGFLIGNRRREDYGETVRSKTDKLAHDRYYQDSDFTVVEQLTKVSKRLGLSNAKVAIAWILQKPGVTSPIIGTTRIEHLNEAVEAMSVKLSPEDMKTLEDVYQPHPILGHSY